MLLTTSYQLEVPMTHSLWGREVSLFPKDAHRTQRNMLLTPLPVYYRRTQRRGSQMEGMQTAGCGEGIQSSYNLSEVTTLPKSPRVHHP